MNLNLLTLRFRDPGLQKAYRLFRGQETRLFIRLGMILSVLTWVMVDVTVYYIFPAHFSRVLALSGILILPYFVALVGITFVDRMVPHIMWMTALANAMAGCLWVYIFQVLIGHTLAAMLGTLVIQYFAFLILRLPVFYGLVATLSYAIPYQLLVAFDPAVRTIDSVVVALGIWFIESLSVVGAYFLNYSMCRIFWQQRAIEEQNESLKESRLQLEIEHERAEQLLLNVLPAPIASRLKKQETIADSHQSTTVLFADLVDFTRLSEKLSAEEIVILLNRVFSRFDDLAERFRLEKIKTIGDAYMVAAGLPEHRSDHAKAMAEMALAMRESMGELLTEFPHPLAVRIGINSGPVVAGVIGKKKFLYDLWGDAVNTAARMESHGLPGEIQTTETTYNLLRNEYDFEERGPLEVKGKGTMHVFLLKGRKSRS